MAKKTVKVYPRGSFYYYQVLKEDSEYSTPHSTHIPVSKGSNIKAKVTITLAQQNFST